MFVLKHTWIVSVRNHLLRIEYYPVTLKLCLKQRSRFQCCMIILLPHSLQIPSHAYFSMGEANARVDRVHLVHIDSAPLKPGSLWNGQYLLTNSMLCISASVHPMNFYYAPTESCIFTLLVIKLLIIRKPWRHCGRGRKCTFVNKIEKGGRYARLWRQP